MTDIKTILLTTDLSETSLKAFAAAQELARRFGARLVVAYVEEDRMPPMVVEYTAVGLDQIIAEQLERATRRLDDMVREHLADDIDVQQRVTSGTPHIEIVRLARQYPADLIVMATHGRGFISHAILGSTTERVLRRTPCPVFVIRDPGDDEDDD